METRSNQILVGSITLGLIAAVVLFVVWLSQLSGGGHKTYDIFFQQSVEGLAKGTGVTFSGVPVGQIDSINLEPRSPNFIRVRITVNDETPVLEGTTATIRGVGFTGVSQIQLDPPEQPAAGQPRRPRAELRCPDENPQSECPYGVPVIPTKPGALGQLAQHRAGIARTGLDPDRAAHRIAVRPQPGIDRRHPRPFRGDQPTRWPSAGPRSRRRWPRRGSRSTRPATPPNGSASSPASTSDLLDHDGRPLIADLRRTLRSADQSMTQLQAAIGDARPGIQAFSNQTLPEVGQLVRDLRATSESLRDITDRMNQHGVGGIIGGPRLPDYHGGGRRH